MTKHRCESALPQCSGVCEEDDQGRFIVGIGTEAEQVTFCPFCGKAAPGPEAPLVSDVRNSGREVFLTTYIEGEGSGKPHPIDFRLLFRRAADAAEFTRVVREAKRPR